MITAPQASIFNDVLLRLQSKCPWLRFIEQDFGQLEDYEIRPSVAWPCALLDMQATNFSDAASHLHQVAVGSIAIRVAFVKYTDTNNLTPAQWRTKGLEYYEQEQEIYKALHGWSPTNCSRLIRQQSLTEKRNDDIRVRVLQFGYSYTDTSAAPVLTKKTIPAPTILGVETFS